MTNPRSQPAPETRGRTIRRWARAYDWLVTLTSLGGRDPLRAAVVERAGLRPGMRVLDVGCGTGALALRLRSAVGASGVVSGIDASPEMIEVATGKARKRGVDLDLRVGVAERLPYDDASFDRVTSTLVFHHLPDDVKLDSLREIRRVLAPGGRLVVADFPPGGGPLPHRVLARLLGLVGHAHAHAHAKGRPLQELMREAGLAEISVAPSDDRNVELFEASRDGAP